MSLVSKQPTNNYAITQAEDVVNNAFYGGPDPSFTEGVIGGHETFGSWFTSGLTGALASKFMGDEAEKDLYIKRNSVNYGMGRINATLGALESLSKVRGFTDEEIALTRELQERKAMIERDLGYAQEVVGGDLDAPIDSEGNSFNDRWGVDNEDVGVYEFLQGVVNNPIHATGIITGEFLKDLPLSVAAWAGLASKGAKGASAFNTIMNKINRIEPKSLRGLTKVATPVGLGAIGGGAYEASYSALNEGKVKSDDVQSGAEFGAAFGLIAGMGVFAKGLIPEQTVKAGSKVSKSNDVGTDRVDAQEFTDDIMTTKDDDEVTTFAKSLMDEHNQRIFPQLTANDYTIMSRADAVKAGFDLKGKDGKGAFVRADAEGKQTIIWGEKETKETFDRLIKDLNKHTDEGGTLANATPRQINSISNKAGFDIFQLAHEKAHVVQNKEGRTYEASPYDGARPGSFNKEVEANQMAFNEVDREYRKSRKSSADKSEVAAEAEARAYEEAKQFLPPDYEVQRQALAREDVVPEDVSTSKVAQVLENNKGKAMLGAATAGYALTEGSDAPYMAALGAAAVLGGPKAYRKLTEMKIPQEVAKARLQAAKAHEGLSVYAKGLETVGQDLGDAITARFPGDKGLQFLDEIEKPTGRFTDKDDIALLKQWRDWHSFLARQGVDVGLFKTSNRKESSTQLVANYASHIIRGKVNPDGSVRPLTNKEKEELIRAEASKIKILGASSTVHNIPRKLIGTIGNLKDRGYAVVDDPAQILSIYTQAMARTIHNRKLLGEFKQLDLGTRDKPLPAMFTKDEFDKFKEGGRLSKEEMLHYSEFDHPSLDGYKVHTNVKSILNDHFEISREGGFNDFKEGLLSLNNSLKRVFVFGSLFHGQALFMSSMYSLGLSGAVKGMFGKGKLSSQHSWKDFELGSGQFKEASMEAIRSGLQIVNVKRQELVNPGKVELDDFLDKLGGVGVQGKKAFGAIDKVTWEFLHDRYKLAAYLKHKEKLMSKGMDDVTSGKKAAEFANDAFGSLDWNDFATRLYDYAYRKPGTLRGKIATKVAQTLPANKRRWLNLGLFAPDWTISNIRIVGKTFTGLPEVSVAVAKRVRDGKWGKQEKEIVQAWNMYAAYAARAGFYTSGMWWMMTELFSDEEPTMEGLGEFWGGDTSGKLQLGGGESMVISKQIAEPIHWVQHPQHTLMNKASVVPKTIMEGMFNKQWFSMKKGFPMGPSIVDMNTGETNYGKWILGKGIPIVAKPLMQDDLKWKERFERTFTGFFGFPQYGNPED
jgi:hypothetical protein